MLILKLSDWISGPVFCIIRALTSFFENANKPIFRKSVDRAFSNDTDEKQYNKNDATASLPHPIQTVTIAKSP